MRFASVLVAAASLVLVAGTASDLPAQRVEAWVFPSSTRVAAETSGPFALLLDRAAELELAREQLDGIGEIRRRLARESEPLEAQIRDAEVWGTTTDEEREALAAVQEQIREVRAGAEEAVAQLLTEEQRERAAAMDEGILLAFQAPPEEEEDEDEDVAGTEETAPERGARASAPPTVVRVENLNFLDATVYVLSGAHRQRLGVVNGLATASFTLPRGVQTTGTAVRFEVRHLARRQSRVSNAVSIFSGGEVHVRIAPS